jgi:hypothetical protein
MSVKTYWLNLHCDSRTQNQLQKQNSPKDTILSQFHSHLNLTTYFLKMLLNVILQYPSLYCKGSVTNIILDTAHCVWYIWHLQPTTWCRKQSQHPISNILQTTYNVQRYWSMNQPLPQNVRISTVLIEFIYVEFVIIYYLLTTKMLQYHKVLFFNTYAFRLIQPSSVNTLFFFSIIVYAFSVSPIVATRPTHRSFRILDIFRLVTKNKNILACQTLRNLCPNLHDFCTSFFQMNVCRSNILP